MLRATRTKSRASNQATVNYAEHSFKVFLHAGFIVHWLNGELGSNRIADASADRR